MISSKSICRLGVAGLSFLALATGVALGKDLTPALPAFHLAQSRPAVPATPAANESSLPNGASSLQETFQDWQVACVQQGTAKRCSLAQQQADPQSKQRVLAVELTSSAGKVSGLLVLPFGLDFERGVALQIDDGATGQPLRFRTCLPVGCLIPLAFEGPMLNSLRQGTSLKAKAMADGGRETNFTISLRGFGPALDRTAALMK